MNGATLLLALSALLDVGANALLKTSDGFRRWDYGVAALMLVLAAFGSLGLALGQVPLATAYATWGAFGLILTALLSRFIDGTRLQPSAWLGLALILGCVVVLHTAH